MNRHFSPNCNHWDRFEQTLARHKTWRPLGVINGPSQHKKRKSAFLQSRHNQDTSNHFERLPGNLEGFHSIRVNKQWRFVFQWDGGRGEAAGFWTTIVIGEVEPC